MSNRDFLELPQERHCASILLPKTRRTADESEQFPLFVPTTTGLNDRSIPDVTEPCKECVKLNVGESTQQPTTQVRLLAAEANQAEERTDASVRLSRSRARSSSAPICGGACAPSSRSRACSSNCKAVVIAWTESEFRIITPDVRSSGIPAVRFNLRLQHHINEISRPLRHRPSDRSIDQSGITNSHHDPLASDLSPSKAEVANSNDELGICLVKGKSTPAGGTAPRFPADSKRIA
jgi:hypothetical protein